MINTNNDPNFNFSAPNNLVKSNKEELLFFNELKMLMYGFGDVENPDNESVELLENYLIEYIQNIALLSYKRSKRRGFHEIKLKDLLYIIQNDKNKFYRVPVLMSFLDTLKNTKKRLDSNLGKKGFKKHLKYLAKENNYT